MNQPSEQFTSDTLALLRGDAHSPSARNFVRTEIRQVGQGSGGDNTSPIVDSALLAIPYPPLSAESNDSEHSDIPAGRDFEEMASSFAAISTSSRNFEKDLSEADVSQENALFSGWKEKREGALARAYPLYLHLLASVANIDRLLAEPFFNPDEGARQRKPSAKKPALLAVQFVAKPQHEDERKTCSSYAPLLAYAALKHIPPEEFAAATTAVTLEEARAFIRQQGAKQNAVGAGPPTAVPDSEGAFQISVNGEQLLRFHVAQLSEETRTDLKTLVSQQPDIGLPELLRKFAALIENAHSASS